MKIVAVLIACLLLIGCAVSRTPDGKVVERRPPHFTLILCVLAICQLPPETKSQPQ